MEGDFIKINEWLLPLSALYGVGVRVRNELFELGLLKQRSFDIPVISVGNITVGGSGKTPMWSISFDCSRTRQRWLYLAEDISERVEVLCWLMPTQPWIR